MKKFKFWKILISVVLVCVLAFSLIACNPPEEPDDGDQTTTSWLNAKTEALNLILGSAVTEFTNGFSQIKEKVINIDFSANWTNNPTDATETKENYTIVLKGNIDITGGQNTSLMFEIVNNSLADNKLVFGAYYNDGENENDLFLILKNDQSLTGTIFGDQPYITGRIDFASVSAIANLVLNDASATESTNDTSSLDIDVIIAVIAGSCKDPVGADPNSTVNPYITANSDGSKDVKITIDLESVMNMVKTMGGALIGFISPSSDGKTNDYQSLSEYFEAVGLYTKVGGEWQPLSHNNLPACTGVDVVLSAKIDASSNLQNLAVEFKNSTAFDFVLGVPSGNTYKELFNFNFPAGSAKLSVDTLNVGTSKDANIASAIDGKIAELDTLTQENLLAFSFSGEVKRYDGNYADATDTYEYKFNIDADVIGAVWAGLEYGMAHKVVKGDMTDAEYDEACYELTMKIVDEVINYLKEGTGKAKIEYWMGNGNDTNTYFYFDAADINTANKEAIITLYTTVAGGQKVKSTLNLYDVIEYAATAAFASEDKATTTLDYKVVIFNVLKAVTGLWGNVNFVDSDNNGVVEYTEVYKTFVDGLYAIFNPTKGTKASIDVVIDTIFGGKDKMSVSIESFSFGNVQFIEPAPSDLEGFTGGGTLSADSFAVSEIQVGEAVTVDGKTFKVLDYLVTGRDEASNNITKAKVIAWSCDVEGDVVNVVLNGGCVVFDITGTNIIIKDVNGKPIA